MMCTISLKNSTYIVGFVHIAKRIFVLQCYLRKSIFWENVYGRGFVLFKKFISCFATALLFAGILFVCPAASAEESLPDFKESGDSYHSFLKGQTAKQADKTFCADITGSVLSREDGDTVFKITVDKTALYNLEIEYKTEKGTQAAIEREVYINKEKPFKDLQSVIFERTFRDEGEITRDPLGNDITPDQEEVRQPQTKRFEDTAGYYNEPYLFLLHEGENEILLRGVQGNMTVYSLTACPPVSVPSYEEKKAEYDKKGYKVATETLPLLNAELATLKSSHTLVPSYDRSSPTTIPYDVSKLRLNTMGGDKWNTAGMWVEWKIDVPESGLYEVNFKYRQNSAKGSTVFRRFTIDGELPFVEAADLSFPYSRSWSYAGSSTNGYLYYLEKGEHTLRLESTLGAMGDILRQSEEFLYRLNALYRSVIMVTGTSPDIYRDYKITQRVEGLEDTLGTLYDEARGIITQIEDIAGGRNSISVMFESFSDQLLKLKKKPEKITSILSDFKNNILSLSSILSQIRETPLELDYIHIGTGDEKLPRADGSIFARIKHELSAFFLSFVEDYNSFSTSQNGMEEITVWVASGREQANILKNIIDSDFKNDKINVNLKLVQGALLQATLAGKAPDVALNLAQSDPVNYALRGAVHPLSDFSDFKEVAARFNAGAYLPFTFDGKVYALPETESYFMMFYRTDILEELGIEPPKTWDELYGILPTLTRNNMDFGLQSTLNTFATLLYQNGGSFYNSEGSESALGSLAALETFKNWTDLYTSYRLPVSFDFANRFRTGEMPIAIVDYTLFNTLSAFAPEIRGLWDFCEIPGTRDPLTGEIDRTTVNSVTGSVILDDSAHKDASWEFIKWWLSDSVQADYAAKLESVLGESARYAAANIKARQNTGWSHDNLTKLNTQAEWVRGIPEVAGGYFNSRHITNAFTSVINKGTAPTKTLNSYVRLINREIEAKRKELQMEN